jgi:hypothetical protein
MTNEAPVTNPKPINRTGGGTEGPEENFEPQGMKMPDNMRKGAAGKAVNVAVVPLEGGSQDVAKYGLARGEQGANS